MEPIATTVPINPIALPLSRGGNAWVIIAIPVAINIAAPIPCTTLNSINCPSVAEMAHKPEPMVKIASPPANIVFLPIISDILPRLRRRLVMVRRYAITTHSMVVISVLKYSVSVGRATFTMLPSSVAMKMPIQTVNIAFHLYSIY